MELLVFILWYVEAVQGSMQLNGERERAVVTELIQKNSAQTQPLLPPGWSEIWYLTWGIKLALGVLWMEHFLSPVNVLQTNNFIFIIENQLMYKPFTLSFFVWLSPENALQNALNLYAINLKYLKWTWVCFCHCLEINSRHTFRGVQVQFRGVQVSCMETLSFPFCVDSISIKKLFQHVSILNQKSKASKQGAWK